MNLIDWEQFEGIVDFSDPECLEIFDEFADKLPSQLEELRALGAASNHPGVADLSHKLRGSCLTFGLVQVSEILTNLERDAKSGGDVNPDIWYDRLNVALEGSQQEISLRRNG
jgi:HPt (histidine-containing phosphotransfer) domain-containing protein